MAVESALVTGKSNECPVRVRVRGAVRTGAVGPRMETPVAKRPRKRFERGVCYKILNANSGTNFRFSSMSFGCGGILTRNYENNAIGVA